MGDPQKQRAADTNPADELARERAARLFRFLQETIVLRTKKVRDLAAYESAFWFHELPREPEVNTLAFGEPDDNEPWLRIDRVTRPNPPTAPDTCDGWFDRSSLDDSSVDPVLFTERMLTVHETPSADEVPSEVKPPPPQAIHIEDTPEVRAAWEQFLAEKWRPWQQEIQRLDPILRCYRKLFAIHQEQERRGEQYELVVGVGTLLWKNERNQTVRRPILTQRATLMLHPASGRIELSVSEESSEITLEKDMLEHDELPPQATQRNVEQRVEQLISPWDRDAVLPILREWFQVLPSAADGTFEDALSFTTPAAATPQMVFAPVLILRKQRAHAILNALKGVEDSLRDGNPIPHGLRRIVDEAESVSHEATDRPGRDDTQLPDEILFPLPANEEQGAIVHQLGRQTGVLVQGPPGTGKSHTIVNLVCHFLARGDRVLVTSQTPRALQVLQDKLPPSILPLVVSVLDEKEQSRKNLERSVHGILEGVDDPNRQPPRLMSRIEHSTRQRTKLRARIAQLRQRQQELREADTIKYAVASGTYSGTAQRIAQQVEKEASQYSWLIDAIADRDLPLSSGEAAELCRLAADFGATAATIVAERLPDCSRLPVSDEFQRVVDACQAARGDANVAREHGCSPRLDWLVGQPDVAERLQSACREWLAIHDDFSARTDWRQQALAAVTTGQSAVWQSLEETTRQAVTAIEQIDPEFYDCEIDSDEAAEQLLPDAEALFRHLDGGGGFGFGPFRASIVRRTRHLWERTRVDGRLCHDRATLSALIENLRFRVKMRRAEREWPEDTVQQRGTNRQRLAFLKEEHSRLIRLLKLVDLDQQLHDMLIGSRSAPLADPGVTQVRVLSAEANAARAIIHENNCEAALLRLVDQVSNATDSSAPHPIAVALRDAAARRDADAYEEALRQAIAAQERHRAARQCVALWERLNASAPRLAERVLSESDRQSIERDMSNLESAWKWKTASEWLIRFDVDHCPADVVRELDQREQECRELTAELIAAYAWKACIGQLIAQPNRQGAMKAWQQTVKRIGKRGKYAETRRREARKYLHQCRDAIPAHVMPLYRVAEQFSFDQPELFDVAIIDEASQTGPEGLLLNFLAKQCIVVGDDKQISPEGGFVDVAAVNDLIQRHIPDVPFASTLQPGASYFDQADIRFQRRITLREHFRCMPEIIRFSNDLCYVNTPLIPLRQYPADRLTPLVDRFVVDGYREGTSERVINRPEAAAVAKAVAECLEDPRYRERSFGVICLQGHAQAQLIENMLLDLVGPGPFQDPDTRLLCGDPYSFQGDERDVIFLSMVAASDGDSRNAPLTHLRFEQRFNVAASRARDQMWLFRSVRESDMNPSCVRRRLVQFMTNNPDALSPGIEQQDLRKAAHVADRSVERPQKPFDSWFEVDVFLALIDRGFRARPQFPVGQKRIDLVVEDATGRVAVECDGDEWHGPDEYLADCDRQRNLERAGWRFVHVRGSSFYANRTAAMDQVIDEVQDAGVGPWQPLDDEAAYQAVDTGEVVGAECLAWLGSRTVEEAEEGLSEIVTDESESEATESSESSGTTSQDRLPTGGQLHLFQADAAGDGNGEVRRADRQGEASRRQSGTSVAVELERAQQSRIAEVLACLFEAREPLTAGQIRWRTGITSEDWPSIEHQLLTAGFATKAGTGRRARYDLTECAAQLPQQLASPSSPADDLVFESADADTWFKIAHWAKVNAHLQPWQRSLAFSLGIRRQKGLPPTDKQAVQGRRILTDCEKLGFGSDAARRSSTPPG